MATMDQCHRQSCCAPTDLMRRWGRYPLASIFLAAITNLFWSPSWMHMHGEADQIVPIATSGPRAVELLKNGTLKTYAGFPHGMPTTHAETINADLLAFLGT